jgi:endoglucanase
MFGRIGGSMRAIVATVSVVLTLGLASCKVEEQKAEKADSGPFELRVDAGNRAAYKDRNGRIWEADRMYRGSAKFGFTGHGGDIVDRGWKFPIEDTDEPRIYQTERWGMRGFVAEVPDGRYTVTLHFAETYKPINAEGARVFDVKIQGRDVLKRFDVLREAGGPQRAVVRTFRDIEVKNGKLEITFVPHEENPIINGIEIVKELP